jgi:hypothetical protein
MKSWGERLIEQGARRARREVAALLLRERFGNVPADLEEQLADVDGATVDTLLVRLIHASSVDEFMAGVQEARQQLQRTQGRSGRSRATRQGTPEMEAELAAWMLLRTVEHIDQDTQQGRLLIEASIRRDKRLALTRQRDIEFVNTEDFIDWPVGQRRAADLVARVTPHNQGPLVVLVHTEIEAEPDADFGFRLWEYNAMLTLRFRPVVITVALLPFMTGRGIKLARYVETAFGQDYIKLEYWRIPLRGLKAADYLAAGPALGAAFAALMRPGSGGTVDLKYAIANRLDQGDSDDATRRMLVDFMKTYLILTTEEQAQYEARLTPKGDRTMAAVEQTWSERLIEQGVLQGKRETIVRQTRERFGTIPAGLEARLAGMDEAALDGLLVRLIHVASADELVAGL